MKYIKKPIVIEAIQFNGSNYEEVILFTKGNAALDKKIGGDEKGNGHPQLYNKLTITTIHQGQEVYLVAGDYVIPEADGIHFYPCKSDVFEKTYDKVEEEDNLRLSVGASFSGGLSSNATPYSPQDIELE